MIAQSSHEVKLKAPPRSGPRDNRHKCSVVAVRKAVSFFLTDTCFAFFFHEINVITPHAISPTVTYCPTRQRPI